jgi:hypothetical protein
MFYVRAAWGTSLLSLTAGIAAAQTTSVGTNSSTIENIGTSNEASVDNGAVGNDRNSSRIAFNGNGNRATVSQVGDDNTSTVRQTGDRNAAALLQVGDRNNSSIDQHIDPAVAVYSNRSASVEQRGSNNSSTINQSGGNNSATVIQGIASLQSFSGQSRINQLSANNIARVLLFETSNSSNITQSGNNEQDTGHVADVAIRGIENLSVITQTGRLHLAKVSLLGGGVGQASYNGRGQGNTTQIFQRGTGHVARVSVGTTAYTFGLGNISSIVQTGEHPTINNHAVVWQRGTFDSVGIIQEIRGAEDDGGSSADVAQLGLENRIDLTQIGRHSARLTQTGYQSTIIANQYDSGGGPPFYGSGKPRPAGAIFRGNNRLLVAQNGQRTSMVAWQEGSDINATLWQKVASVENHITLNQGRLLYFVIGAPQCSSGCQFASGASANVTQQSRFNGAEVNQYAASRAVIEQRGTGTFNYPNRILITQTGAGNSATILQTAGVGPSSTDAPPSGNSAAQNQQLTGDSSAAADEFYFGGGARNTESRLIQLGTNSTASIEQRGRGQFALIEQQGNNNNASILQDGGATNATAAIRQSGSGNSYSITQAEPGQYMVVTQTGTNNSATDVVRRGPGS